MVLHARLLLHSIELIKMLLSATLLSHPPRQELGLFRFVQRVPDVLEKIEAVIPLEHRV
jgi:hypothetical protein